jgi:hypothetical protein
MGLDQDARDLEQMLALEQLGQDLEDLRAGVADQVRVEYQARIHLFFRHNTLQSFNQEI